MKPRINCYDIATDVKVFSTTRHGGVSKGNYGEFNINQYCGDAPQAISTNLEALTSELELSPDNLFMPHQVHGIRNVDVDGDFLSATIDERKAMLEGVDSLTTCKRGICIGVSTADCIPVILYDKVHQATAAIHAGWRGTRQRIVVSTLHFMQTRYDTSPSDIVAVIGPGISLKNFEVGQEVYDAFAESKFDMSRIAKKYEKWHINLPLCNQMQLEHEGVKPENIIQSGICTYDNVDDYFSARRLGQRSGRIYTGIILL